MRTFRSVVSDLSKYLCGLTLAMCGSVTPASSQFSAEGNDNPTLAFNTGSTADFVAGMQFLDIAKSMRPWIGHKPDQWGFMKYAELVKGGYIDADGWVRAVPEGLSHVGTIWQWSNAPQMARHRIGRYILTYEGEGTLNVGGDAQIIERAPGRIVFANLKGKNLYLSLRDLDPKGTGNYIRNISIIPEKHAELFAIGGRFNPDWLALIKDARVLRFMNWTRTNNAKPRTWEDWPTSDELFAGRGVPIAYLVQIANEVGADPWFTMPHNADTDYIRKFAQFVRDTVDPALTIRVEYSNETWNGAFQQAKWIRAQAKKAGWGDAHHAYHTRQATAVAQVWNNVFGAEAETRLRHVLGTQASNSWATNERLEAAMWRKKEPQTFVPPSDTFDELAITNYFGSATVGREDMREQLLSKIKDPRIDAQAWLAKRLMDPNYRGSIAYYESLWSEQATLAHQHGLKLVAYEGGQHVHHSFAVRGISKDDMETLRAFMIAFVRSPYMARLYEASWVLWAKLSDGPFMQFEEISRESKWGAWGLRNSLVDTSPRAEAVARLSARTSPWWQAAGGVHYQQGVHRVGGADADDMRGTLQEDYLIGKAGDDIFHPGPGNDGVHGGPGQDRVIFSGAASDYVIRPKGDGIELTGPDGVDMLVSVEMLEFASGEELVTINLR